jgi:hypothetical protein
MNGSGQDHSDIPTRQRIVTVWFNLGECATKCTGREFPICETGSASYALMIASALGILETYRNPRKTLPRESSTTSGIPHCRFRMSRITEDDFGPEPLALIRRAAELRRIAMKAKAAYQDHECPLCEP